MLRSEIALTLKKRRDYIESIQEGIESGEIKIEDLVFVDEAGSKLGMSSNYSGFQKATTGVAILARPHHVLFIRSAPLTRWRLRCNPLKSAISLSR